MVWSVELLDERVRGELDALSPGLRASFRRIVELIGSQGLERLREPYVKHLEGPLWEIRMSAKGEIARAAYVTAVSRRVVVVHVFSKKSMKTPRRAIEVALRRSKEVD